MNQTQRSNHPLTRLYALPFLLLLLLVFGAAPETAQGQWAASGTGSADISNTNTGNVGIGTATPAAKLDVNGGAIFSGSTTVAGRGTFFIDPTNNALNFSVAPNAFKINATAGLIVHGPLETFDNYFGMRHMNSNVLLVRIPAIGSAYFNQGNVGVGTTDPLSQLHVHNPWGGAHMRVSGGGFSAINFIDSNAPLNSKLFQWRSEGGLFRMALVNDAENAYAQQNLLVANAAGNVGIGTAVPASKFTVADGSIHLQTTSLVSGGSMGDIGFGPGGGAYWGVTPRAFMRGYFQGPNWYSGTALSFFTHGGGDITVNNAAERMRIDKDGNVGIGTAAPAYKLDVSGEINATGLRINGTSISAGGGTTQWATGTSSIYYTTNNVGIGTNNPGARLDVLQTNGAAVRALSGSITAHTSIQLGRVATEGTLGIAGNAGDYAAGALAGDVILRTEAADKKLIFANGHNSPTVSVANTGVGVTGNMNVTGTITGGVIEAKYQDVAEWVESSQKLEAGTVVALDPEKSNQVLASSEAYDTKVAGVVSARPGISLGEKGEGKVLVATTGRVRVKVDATRAPIKIGDLLVTSDVHGVAMKSEPVVLGTRKLHAPGTIIGKALEPLEKGMGEILVLLSIQ